VDGVFSALLGDDYVYLGSDGKLHGTRGTQWHSDGNFDGRTRGAPPSPGRQSHTGTALYTSLVILYANCTGWGQHGSNV
jgi:hypothetical protein